MADPPVRPRSLYTAKRSPLRVAVLVAGMVILIAAVVAIVVSALGGSSSGKAANAATGPSVVRAGARSHKHPAGRAHTSTVAAPSETSVTVLNATETVGLAHRTAAELQQNGYSLATAQSGRPPGSEQVSVVQYASGHKPEAEGVAHALAITEVVPVEAGVSALASSASVVVVVGADRAGEGQ